MPDFFAKLDGTGRKPRASQSYVLETLAGEWDKWDVFAVTAPTAAGKSLIGRSIQRATDGAFITADNALLKQFASDYNSCYFWGADNYHSREEYEDAKILTLDAANHVAYNPISFRNASRQKGFEHPPVIVMDEGDAALGLLSEYTSTVVPITKGQFSKGVTAPEAAAQIVLMHAANKRCTSEEQRIKRKYMLSERTKVSADRLEDLADMLLTEGERYAIWVTEEWAKYGTKRSLHIKPLSIPKTFAESYFKKSKIILMSATLLPSDVRELTGGKHYKQIEVASPIPPERRRIYSFPTSFPLAYPTPHQELAAHLDSLLEEFKDLRPAMIHLPYSDAAATAAFMTTPVLTHDKETKKEVLQQWLDDGGVLMGSGMSTGLDLKGDLCRLNIVGKVLFPNIMSPVWKKKMALPGGDQAYQLAALRQLIQALGRSTRSENDWSVSIILDRRWMRLYNSCKEEVPSFLKEAIVWEKKTSQEVLAHVATLNPEDAE